MRLAMKKYLVAAFTLGAILVAADIV